MPSSLETDQAGCSRKCFERLLLCCREPPRCLAAWTCQTWSSSPLRGCLCQQAWPQQPQAASLGWCRRQTRLGRGRGRSWGHLLQRRLPVRAWLALRDQGRCLTGGA